MHVVSNWYLVHTLIKATRKIKFVHEVSLVCDHLKHTKRLLVRNRAPELSLYTFKPVCGTTLENPWGKPRNLLRMKLTTDVTSPFLLEVNNDIFFYFLCRRCGQ